MPRMTKCSKIGTDKRGHIKYCVSELMEGSPCRQVHGVVISLSPMKGSKGKSHFGLRGHIDTGLSVVRRHGH